MSGTATGIAPDAAMALGIAATAMPFAPSRAAGVERWLRILRLYGETGAALQALGLGEAQLRGAIDGERGHDRADLVEEVAERARQIGGRRGVSAVATTDLLLAVMDLYGSDFDRVLAAHGVDRDEVTARLGVELPANGPAV